MVSRRKLLAGSALSGITAVSGCLSATPFSTSPDFITWSPSENTWPLPHYDPENTNYNPTARPSRSAVERKNSIEVESSIIPPVISKNHIVINGPNGGIFQRDDLSSVWNPPMTTYGAAFAPTTDTSEPRLYVAQHQTADQPITILSGVALTDGEANIKFEKDINIDPLLIIATDSYLFLGGLESHSAIFDSFGDAKWEVDGIYGAISDNTIIMEQDGMVRRYDIKTNSLLSPSIEQIWEKSASPSTSYPALGEDTVLVGGSDFTPINEGYIHAFDLESGERKWEPKSFGELTSTPAVGDGICYLTGHSPTDSDRDDGKIAAVDITDGATLWETTVDWYAYNPILTGNNMLLVSHFGYDSYEYSNLSHIAAYDIQTGDELWTYEATAPVMRLCPVGDEIYVATRETFEVLQ